MSDEKVIFTLRPEYFRYEPYDWDGEPIIQIKEYGEEENGLYGTFAFALSEKEIGALLDGKVLSCEVNSEYRIIIAKATEEEK